MRFLSIKSIVLLLLSCGCSCNVNFGSSVRDFVSENYEKRAFFCKKSINVDDYGKLNVQGSEIHELKGNKYYDNTKRKFIITPDPLLIGFSCVNEKNVDNTTIPNKDNSINIQAYRIDLNIYTILTNEEIDGKVLQCVQNTSGLNTSELQQIGCNNNNRAVELSCYYDIFACVPKSLSDIQEYSSFKSLPNVYWYYRNKYNPKSTKILYYTLRFFNFLGFIHLHASVFKEINIGYFIRFFIIQSLFKDIGSTRFWFGIPYVGDKLKSIFGGRWYCGCGNVPYVGWMMCVALVFAPAWTEKFPKWVRERVTIHVLGFKPLFAAIIILLTRFLIPVYLDQCKCCGCDHNKLIKYYSFVLYKKIEPTDNNKLTFDDFEKMEITTCKLNFLEIFGIHIRIFKYWDISINMLCLFFIVRRMINILQGCKLMSS